MAKKILVAFATKYGSTEQAAETIAAALRARGNEVTLEPARQVQSLAGYDKVILGAPLYMFHWHKDALRFLSRHQAALKANQPALFALGPTNDTAQEFAQAREHLDKALAGLTWLVPRAVQVFGGKIDPSILRFPYSLFRKSIPAGDIMDPGKLKSWALGLLGA